MGFGRERTGHVGKVSCCTETLEALVVKNPFVFALNLMQFFRLHFLAQCTNFSIVHSDDAISLNMTISKEGLQETGPIWSGLAITWPKETQCLCLESDHMT